MPNVVIVRNTYPDTAALNNVIDYVLSKAAFCGGYGVTPEIEAAQMQMLLVKQAFYQMDALQLKHFFITCSHDEVAYIDFEEMLRQRNYSKSIRWYMVCIWMAAMFMYIL